MDARLCCIEFAILSLREGSYWQGTAGYAWRRLVFVPYCIRAGQFGAMYSCTQHLNLMRGPGPPRRIVASLKSC